MRTSPALSLSSFVDGNISGTKLDVYDEFSGSLESWWSSLSILPFISSVALFVKVTASM